MGRNTYFRDLVLYFYDYKCALWGPAIRYADRLNLEAAHIVPKAFKGGDNPLNGLCLSRDFHWALDNGFFTINSDYTIRVHPKSMKILSLSGRNGKKLLLPKDQRTWPDQSILQFHRKKIFGRFLKF